MGRDCEAVRRQDRLTHRYECTPPRVAIVQSDPDVAVNWRFHSKRKHMKTAYAHLFRSD
jgi:hypothetical protein